jgi:hypothetical protein
VNNRKPDEMAQHLYNENLYFCGSKGMAFWNSIFWVQKFIDYCQKMDDKIYWTLVKDELHKIDIFA